MRSTREVEELGLASVIAYNHGVEMLKEKRFHRRRWRAPP